MVTSLLNDIYSCQLSSDKCTIPERIQREREREKDSSYQMKLRRRQKTLVESRSKENVKRERELL
jgi:hypothetical protein